MRNFIIVPAGCVKSTMHKLYTMHSFSINVRKTLIMRNFTIVPARCMKSTMQNYYA
jgi:hypothetical protein